MVTAPAADGMYVGSNPAVDFMEDKCRKCHEHRWDDESDLDEVVFKGVGSFVLCSHCRERAYDYLYDFF